MAYQSYERSIPDIATDLLSHFPILIRKEAQLARVELSENMSRIGFGIAFIGIGAVLLIPALVVLLEAGVAALERAGFLPAISSLIVGGAAFVVGVILMLIGIGRMKAANLVPERTIQQVQADASVAKQQMRTDNDFQRAA